MFTYPVLLWGTPFVFLVVLIHLINVYRHRPVFWGAMEFILIAYKKNQRRIFWQQFLLILVRSLLILCLILFLAQPHLPQSWSMFLGKKRPTLHVLLLDDSFSMNDCYLGESVFEQAKEVAIRIIDNQRSGTRNHNTNYLSLLRFSQETFDFSEHRLDEKGERIVQEKIRSIPASETDAGPQKALAAAWSHLVTLHDQYNCIIYLISDFRKTPWEQLDTLKKPLNDLKNLGSTIRLIRTVDTQHPNLAILDVRFADGICAAGIPVLFEVTIANFGAEAAMNIPCSVIVNDRKQSSLIIPNVEPGMELSVRFPITFEQSGPHRVELQLEPDSVKNDNSFPLMVNIPQNVSVLLITSDSPISGSTIPGLTQEWNDNQAITPEMPQEITESGSRYIRAAIAPEGIKTGINVQIEKAHYLDRVTLQSPSILKPSKRAESPDTSSVDIVIFPDLSPLPLPAIRNLETFVNNGGNVVFFCGPQTQPELVNEQLFRNGQGLFPVALGETETLFHEFLEKRPDLTIASHPLFRAFEQDGKSLLNTVQITRYFSITNPELAESHSILANLRNGAPLLLESRFGQGQVITFLTTAAPLWNNWGRGNPAYVIMLLELISHLSHNRDRILSQPVRAPLLVEFDPLLYDDTVSIVRPTRQQSPTDEPQPEERLPTVTINSSLTTAGTRIASFQETEQSGFYEIQLIRRANEIIDREQMAVHVNGHEGNLALADRAILAESLQTFGIQLEEPNTVASGIQAGYQYPLTGFLFGLLLCLLVSETLLARQGLNKQGRERKIYNF